MTTLKSARHAIILGLRNSARADARNPIADAVRMAQTVRYRNAGTFEFLVDADELCSPLLTKEGPGKGRSSGGAPAYAFLEVNPRLQVEHTVTEEVMGVDLVRLQLQLAAGHSLADVGWEHAPTPRGFAVQARINTETVDNEGIALCKEGGRGRSGGRQG